RTVPVEALPEWLRSQLQAIQAMGFVVVICLLLYDLGIPCFLVLALRGTRFAYGLGCQVSAERALAHAILELWARLIWLFENPSYQVAQLSFSRVTTPRHHYELYNEGPLPHVLRTVL